MGRFEVDPSLWTLSQYWGDLKLIRLCGHLMHTRKGRYGLVHDAGRNGSRLKRLTWTRRGGCVPYRGARRVTIENLQYLMINGHNLLIAKLAGHRRWRVLRLPPSRAMATRRSRHRWSGHVVGLSHQGPMRRGGSEAARRAYRRTRTHLIRHAGWKHRTQGKIEPRTGGWRYSLGVRAVMAASPP